MNKRLKIVAVVTGVLLAVSCTGAVASSSNGPVECDITDNTLTCPLPAPPPPVTETVTATTTVTAPAGPETLFGDAVPANPADPDPDKVELGVKFKPALDGVVTGVRFYKGAGNTGTHTGSLWSGNTRVATVTFTGETESGWQQMKFATPVIVKAGTEYIASYLAPVGKYAGDGGYAWPKVSGNLTGLGSLYTYGGGLPSQTFNNSNYYVDVLFLATGDAPTTTTAAPTLSATTTAATTTSSATSSAATTTTTPPNPPVLLDLPRIPWEGGPAYWSQFPAAATAGWSDPSFFPITVFLGKPAHAAQYKALGVNTYQAAERDGSTIASMTDQGMFVLPQQDEWTSAQVGSNPKVPGWFISDECDMGLGGCAAPDGVTGTAAEQHGLDVQQGYVNKVKAYNDGRFTQANFGNGILGTHWSPTTMDDHLQLVDAASIDKYAYTSPHVQDLILQSPAWTGNSGRANVARAASYGWLTDRMTTLEGSNLKPRWMFVEVAKPYLTESGAQTITPDQLEGAVWSAIIHEARGINYFQHNNNGSCGTYALVDCEQARKDKVQAVNGQVTALAPVINTQSYAWDFQAPGIDTMLKAKDGAAYVFAGVGLKGATGNKSFTLPAGVSGATVEVVGENRTIPVTGGKFTDGFAAEYAHHIYKITI